MYLKWKEITTLDLSDSTLTNLYSEGFVLTRKGKGALDQTRSLRIDLNKFVLSSENRRVLKKTEGLELEVMSLPYSDYTWEIGKLGKDFYEDKFGVGTFSANKIKELLTDSGKSNFNIVLVYKYNNIPVGYTITYQNSNILHYSYPFYDRATEISNLGLGMMLRAILHAQESGKKYIYLGSAQRPTDTYKLQFSGLEWFDSQNWETDLKTLEKILTTEQKIESETEIEEIKITTKEPKKITYFLQSFFEAILANLGVSIIIALAFGLSGWAYYLGYETGFDHKIYALIPHHGATYIPSPYEGVSNQFKPSPVFGGVIGILFALFFLYLPVTWPWGIISIGFYSLFVFWIFYFYKKNISQKDTYYRTNKKQIKKYLLIGAAILVVAVFSYGFLIGIQRAGQSIG